MKTKKILLIAMAICLHGILVNAQNNIPQDSLIVYYPFNNDFNDKSGNNYNGKVNEAVLTGTKNKACFFDGINDYIEVQGIEPLTTVRQLTISCWIKPFSEYSYDAWISKANDNNRNSQWRLSFGANPDNFVDLTIYNGDWTDYNSNFQLEIKKWYHVLYLIDNIKHKASIYINGKNIKSFDIRELSTSNGSLLIGYQKDDGRFYNGLVDEVLIYSRLLKESEIQMLYDNFKNTEKAELNEQIFPVLKGDYLGQTPPGDTPVVFARGIVSTKYQNHSVSSFSPDGNEVFWQVNRRPESENGKWLSYSMTMRRTGDRWTAPEVTSYSSMPFFSPDGQRIYFNSEKNGLNFVEKQGNSWSEPKSLGLVAHFPELQFAIFPSIASNGTLYFVGYAAGLWNNFGIYRAELINGEYAKPELLPPSINAPGGMRNWAPFIAPDESYLIFCSTRGLPNYDEGDLFVCFRQPDGSWTEPVTMGAPINTNQMERFSAVSPDGKYLFFTRWTPDYDEDVFWVNAEIIGKLKAKAIQEKRLKQ